MGLSIFYLQTTRHPAVDLVSNGELYQPLPLAGASIERGLLPDEIISAAASVSQKVRDEFPGEGALRACASLYLSGGYAARCSQLLAFNRAGAEEPRTSGLLGSLNFVNSGEVQQLLFACAENPRAVHRP